MDSEDYRIPRYLDEPELFPIWTKGETALLLAPVLIGFLLGQGMGLLIGLAIGATLLKLFKNFGSSCVSGRYLDLLNPGTIFGVVGQYMEVLPHAFVACQYKKPD